MAKVGDKIKIISMEGEPHYTGKEGVVEHIDSIGQLHGSWGGLAINPNVDTFTIINNEENKMNEEKTFDCLTITNVAVFPFKDGTSLGHMKGLASIVFNDQFMVRGLRIMDGENGLFVGYPNDPFYKGEDFRTICSPMTRQLREHIEDVVLNKYLEEIKD